MGKNSHGPITDAEHMVEHKTAQILEDIIRGMITFRE